MEWVNAAALAWLALAHVMTAQQISEKEGISLNLSSILISTVALVILGISIVKDFIQ